MCLSFILGGILFLQLALAIPINDTVNENVNLETTTKINSVEGILDESENLNPLETKDVINPEENPNKDDLVGQESFYPIGGFWWGRPIWGGWGSWGGYRPWHGFGWGGWHGPHWGGHWGGPWRGR